MTNIDLFLSETAKPTSPNNPNVLLITRNEAEHMHIQELLGTSPSSRYELEWLPFPEETIETLQSKHPDIILINHSKNNPEGLELLYELKLAKIKIPMIVLTGIDTNDADLKAMQAGASDYLLNEHLSPYAIDRAIHYAIRRHKTLQALADSERTKELFYATLAHDLKTPIFGQQKILDHLNREAFGPLTAEQHSVVHELLKSNHYLYQMVSNLLSSYKYQHNQIHLKKESVQYNTLIQELLSNQLMPLAREKNQHITLDLDPDITEILLDVVEIKRVMFNLVHNAINYSPEKSTIIVKTRLAQAGQPPHPIILTEIQDFGPGIHSEQIPTLFQPYSTVKTLRPIGTGLGLYLARQVIDAHEGSIGVTSTPGIGSCFYFSLPLGAPKDDGNR